MNQKEVPEGIAKKSWFAKTTGLLAMIIAITMIGLLVFALSFWPTLLMNSILSIILGVLLPTLGFVFIYLLDRSRKIANILHIGKFNLKWGVILLFGILSPLVGLIGFYFTGGFSLTSFDFDWGSIGFQHLFFYLLCSLICFFAAFFIYFGSKTFSAKYPEVKIKQIALCFGLIFVIGGISAGAWSFTNYSYLGYVEDRYLWDDGPWLTWEDDPTSSITISWTSSTPTDTKLYFGNSAENLEQIVFNTSQTYVHHAEIIDLNPDTQYYYQIDRDFVADHRSDLFSFKTAPASYRDFKAVIVGDMQPSSVNTKTLGKTVAEGILAESPDFVVQLGDVSSNGGSLSLWHNVLQNFPLFGANIPFQSTGGNHDYDGDRCQNFRALFHYNYEEDNANYYSFDYLNSHFINVDNFVAENSQLGETQKQWIISDLEDAQARGQKWIFISFHHTMMTTGTSSQNFELQKWMVPVADKYGVDGVFFAHDHHYEHWNYTYGSSGLLYNETDLPSGNPVQYFISGGGGASLEVGYGVLKHDTYVNNREFYNISANEYQDITITRNHWDETLFVENSTNKIYAQDETHELYYHAPEIASFSTDNDILGYEYGEQTRHYMVIEISNNGNTCTISAHYPNGNVLMGPNNAYPQSWEFNK